MKKFHNILGMIQAFTAIGAIPAAYGFLSDISGAGMGTNTELLAKSPFDSFLIPGLFLLIVNGFGNAIGAFLSFRMKALAGMTGIVLGIILCFWIIIQVYWIGLGSLLQPFFLIVGIAEAWLGWYILKHSLVLSQKPIQ